MATFKLSEYLPPTHRIPTIDLEFIIHSHKSATVRSRMKVIGSADKPLELKGEAQVLKAVKVDGRLLDPKEYTLTDSSLTFSVPKECIVEVESEIDPLSNKALSGLYASGDILCTQCEAQGFRRITYHPDRPDVMGKYTTRIEADKALFPTLLSNGNLVDKGELPDNRHFVRFNDPFSKPSYLFALVAGDLGCLTDSFITQSGKEVLLQVYVQKGKEPRAQHALRSLKKAMKWDEDTFGLECDLDMYTIVGVEDFNAGAMENKGLNIFNSSAILADPATATDREFEWVEAVIAHEYFHNWTGNRITLRDWFQLTLKEGLTVYRDERFTADQISETLKRIKDVTALRNNQFPEDSGPNAHPIQPKEVAAIENFYSSTVYSKGAEVIRMIETLIGKEMFRKGMDAYVGFHDGSAVTTEEFVRSMEIASGKDLTQFRRWYDQAGTPKVKASSSFDGKGYTLMLEQSNNGQEPLLIPFRLGLVGKDGKDKVSTLLELTEKIHSFHFPVSERPIPSLLRGFSAPVKVEYDYSPEELTFLLAHDSDGFNRYDAGQRLALQQIHSLLKEDPIDIATIKAFGTLLQEKDYAFAAQALTLPGMDEIIEDLDVIPMQEAVLARRRLQESIASTHEREFLRVYHALHGKAPYSIDNASIAKRSLANVALGYLVSIGHFDLAAKQFETADNMTDKQAALMLLASRENPFAQKNLASFADEWKDDALVMNKWFLAQARADREDVLEVALRLERHPSYNPKNPDKIRNLWGWGVAANLEHFHTPRGYEVITDKILEIDAFNPKMAAELAENFSRYKRLPKYLQDAMRAQMERIMAKDPSTNVQEIVGKTLQH